MMRTIGWTLACALLAATSFPKSAILAAVESGGVVGWDRHEVARGRASKLLPISKDATVDQHVSQLRRSLDGVFNDVRDAGGIASRQGRTFGQKRIQFMLMPMMYKMGVMMTMLAVLTVISLKGLLIGAALLMLKVGTLIAKFSTGWQQSAHAAQPIHVHVHNSLPTAHSQAYGGWMPPSGPETSGEHYYYRG